MIIPCLSEFMLFSFCCFRLTLNVVYVSVIFDLKLISLKIFLKEEFLFKFRHQEIFNDLLNNYRASAIDRPRPREAVTQRRAGGGGRGLQLLHQQDTFQRQGQVSCALLVIF